jgi:hypothetical protein
VNVIDTREKFVEWLDSEACLQDAVIDELLPLPAATGEPLPDRARLSFRVQISGGLVAGETRRMRQLTVEATDITAYELPIGGFSEGNCCQGAEVRADAPVPIAFTIDVPVDLHVQCERIEVTNREWDEVVPEWFSKTEFSAVIRGATLPSPEDWVAAFAARGLRVAWRYYDGPATDPTGVTTDYEGWFVQHADRVSSSTGGLFFLAARQKGQNHVLSVRDQADDGGALWRTCGTHIGSQLNVEVHCGNVVLSGSAWVAHLNRAGT